MNIAIVGSGISGLSAALLLAKQGHKVSIFEAGPRPAPLLAGFRRKGLLFDTGFHYGGGIGEGGILRQWLQALDIEKYLEFYPEGSSEVFFFEDGSQGYLHAGEALLPSIEKQFPGHGLGMQDIVHDCDAVLQLSPYTNPHLEEDPSLHLGNAQSTLAYLADKPLPQRLKAMLMARCLLYGTPPSQSSWEHYALVSGPYFHSCGTWKGGGEALVKALLQELKIHDVSVQCRSRVQAILGQKSTGIEGIVLENGQQLSFEQCYFTGHPKQLQSLLPQGALRPAFYTHIEDIPETLPVLMLFAQCSAFEPGQSMYVLTEEHEKNPDSMFSSEGQESGLYMCTGYPAPEAQDSTSLPLMMLRFLPPCSFEDFSKEQYAEYKAKAVQELVELAEKRCPQLRGKWRVLDAATERTMRQWVVGGTGSLYGMQHRVQDMPLLSVTRMPGLFLAGQNIILPGVLGGIISAALAVGFSLGHDMALKEFRACARA